MKTTARILGIAGLMLALFGTVFFRLIDGIITTKFWITLAAGGLLIIIYFIVDHKNIISFLKMRSVAKIAVNIFYMLIAIVILSAAFVIVKNFPQRFDVSADERFTISDISRDLIEKVDEKLLIIVFRSEADMPEGPRWKIDLLLKEFSKLNKNIELQYIDPVKEPRRADKNGYRDYGGITLFYRELESERESAYILESDIVKYDRQQNPKALNRVEEKLSSAIYSLVEDAKTSVYFTMGHGEPSLESGSEDGMSYIRGFLESENYRVRVLDTAKRSEIPEDAALLIIAGPKRYFTAHEIKMFDSYLDGGGKMIVLYDSVIEGDNFPLINLEKFLESRGFSVFRDYILDPSSSVERMYNVIPGYAYHTITTPLQNKQIYSCLIRPRTIMKNKNADKKAAFAQLLATTENAWGETDFSKESYDSKPEKGKDIKGPLNVAMLAEYQPVEKEKEGDEELGAPALLLVGDSDFAKNKMISVKQGGSLVFLGNIDFFLNSAAFLTGSESKISIRPKPQNEENLTLSRQEATQVMIFVQFIMPGLFVIIGIIVWYTRRK